VAQQALLICLYCNAILVASGYTFNVKASQQKAFLEPTSAYSATVV